MCSVQAENQNHILHQIISRFYQAELHILRECGARKARGYKMRSNLHYRKSKSSIRLVL